jgi:hypothetical protein
MNSEQVASIAGITKRQLDNWVTKGWLKPTVVSGQGWGGTQREFDGKEAEVARLMGRLTRAGLYPNYAHKVARGHRMPIATLLGVVAECMGNGELIYKWFDSAPRGSGNADGSQAMGSAGDLGVIGLPPAPGR